MRNVKVSRYPRPVSSATSLKVVDKKNMSVKDLPALGKFLLGEGADDTPGWLQVWLSTKSFTESKNLNFQAVHSSTSPLGDFLALGLEQRLVLLGARYSSGRRQLVPVFQVALPPTCRTFSCCLVAGLLAASKG